MKSTRLILAVILATTSMIGSIGAADAGSGTGSSSGPSTAATPKLATTLPEKLPAKLPAKTSQKPAAKATDKAAAKLPRKKVVAKNVKAAATKKVVTALPAFKGKKHLVTTSSSFRSSDDSQAGVVVRSMSNTEYAKYAARMAEEEKQNSATTQVIRVKRGSQVAQPQPVETLQVTAAEQDNTPDIGEAPRPRIVEAPIAEPRIEAASTAMAAKTVGAKVAEKVAELPVKAAPSDFAVKPVPQAAAVVAVAPTPAPVTAPTPAREVISEPAFEPRTIAPTVPFVVTMPTPPQNLPPVAPPMALPAADVSKPTEPQPPARPQTESVYEAKANSVQDAKPLADRVSISTAYLAAHYSQIEGQLEDGATSIGFGYAHDFGVIEGRAGLEFVHGLDQSVSPGNARMIMLRGDAAYFFSKGTVSPFVAGGLALAKVNVQSYRLQTDGTTVLRDHDSTTAVGITPAAGVRFRVTKSFDLELKVEELAFLLSSDASALGGLSAGGALGFSF